jgi:hypothetical protein
MPRGGRASDWRLLLRTKRTLENTLRDGVKRFGLITRETVGRTFTHRTASVLDQDPTYAAFAAPILAVLRSVLVQIREHDRQLRSLARRDDGGPAETIPGVGYLTDRVGLKKAQVTVARKPSVMMHAIWAGGTEFERRNAATA